MIEESGCYLTCLSISILEIDYWYKFSNFVYFLSDMIYKTYTIFWVLNGILLFNLGFLITSEVEHFFIYWPFEFHFYQWPLSL